MPNLGQSYRWTKAQRKAASIRMKAAYAKKKYNKDQGQIGFPPVPEKIEGTSCLAPDVDPKRYPSAENIERNYEFQFRRGLVTAMECILRELR